MASGLLLAGTVLSAGTSIAGGIEAKKAAEAEADILRQEGEFAEDQARDEALRFQKGGESFLGTQRAGVAASGVKLEGSPLAALQESEANLAQDVARIKESGKNAAALAKSRAAAMEKQGSFALAGGILGAGSTLLTKLGYGGN